jgi:hypothetical protein
MKTSRVLIWAMALVGADIVLTLVVLAAGDLHAGRAPLLDQWDLVKSAGIAALLLTASIRIRSAGLSAFGATFLLIGLIDGTAAHAVLARPLARLIPFDEIFGVHPTSAEGVAELVVLLAIGVVMLTVILIVPDRWSLYPPVRRRLLALLIGLVFFAGFIDLVDDLTGIQGVWSLVEETGERLMFSLTLAYATQVWALVGRRADEPPPDQVERTALS